MISVNVKLLIGPNVKGKKSTDVKENTFRHRENRNFKGNKLGKRNKREDAQSKTKLTGNAKLNSENSNALRSLKHKLRKWKLNDRNNSDKTSSDVKNSSDRMSSDAKMTFDKKSSDV